MENDRAHGKSWKSHGIPPVDHGICLTEGTRNVGRSWKMILGDHGKSWKIFMEIV